MAGVSEFRTILNNDSSKSNYGRIRDIEIIDKAFKVDESLGNEDLKFATPEEREKYYAMIQNKKFRVTENDLLEFNQWIKSKMPEGQKPRLLAQFNSENEYEEYMINYQNEHMSLEADPAVLKTDKNGRTFSEKKMRTFSDGDYIDLTSDKDQGEFGHDRVDGIKGPGQYILRFKDYKSPDYRKDRKVTVTAVINSSQGAQFIRVGKTSWYYYNGSEQLFKKGAPTRWHLTPSEWEKFKTMSRTFSEDIPSDAKKVVVYTSNPDQLIKLLTAIQEVGNPGHSFEIVVDPDSTETEGGNQKFGWDGDGSDRIYKISQEEQRELDKKCSRTFSERCEFFSKKKITQCPETHKWFIEGVEIPFETEESAKIALATMVVKGEPSDNNPDLDNQ